MRCNSITLFPKANIPVHKWYTTFPPLT